MKKLLTRNIAVLIVATLGVFLLSAFYLNISFKPKLDMSGFVYVSSMRTTNGTFLGKIYAKYLTDDVFTDLYILGSNDEVLYKIDKSGFFNKTGVEREMRGVGFYGFKFALKSSDHIVVTPLYDEGRDVSDDVTIRWNSGNNDFEIMKFPF